MLLFFDIGMTLPACRSRLKSFKRGRAILLFFVLIIPSFLLKDKVGVFYSLEKGLSKEITAVADSEKLRKKHGVAEVVYLIVEDKGLKTEQTLTERTRSYPS